MKRLAFLLLSAAAAAQTFPVSGHVLRGDNTAPSNGKVTFSLVNTGDQQCRVAGTGEVVQPQSLSVNASTGAYSGNLFRNDQITCGNQQNTQWSYQVFDGTRLQPPCVLAQITGGTALNIDSTACSNTTPVVSPPTGDTTYCRLDGSNCGFTGNVTVPGNSLTAKVTNAALNATQYSGADIGAQVNTAEASADCPTNGCIIHIPAASYSFSTKISITKPVNLICDGASEGATTGPTQLTWTGGATPAISLVTGAASSVIWGCNLNNTGTGAVGIDIDSTTNNLDRVVVEKSAVFNFTVGIRLGNTAAHNTVNTVVKDTLLAGNGTNIQILQAFNTIISNLAAYHYTTLDVQIGDSTHGAVAVHFLNGCDLEPVNTTNTTVVQILNGEDVNFDDTYFESDGTGFAIDVPSTATNAIAIHIDHSRFIGAGAGNNSQFALRSALASATWTIANSYFKRYTIASPSIMQNTAVQQVVFSGILTDASTSLVSGSPTGVLTHLGAMFGSTWIGGRVQVPSGQLFIFDGTGQVQLGGNLLFNEIRAPSGSANSEVCYGDSTAHALKCSYNNGTFLQMPQVIASSTAVMTTGAINSLACGTTVTVSATGVATTDTITWAFNAAPAANPAELVVSAWPTANNVNFQYCNPTAGTVTPNAATLNWRVVR